MARILTVDDSTPMRNLLSATLEDAGYAVLTAMDGEDALRIARKDSALDLVITDVNMPNMDGLALVRQLRLLPHCKGLPLLILSTESDVGKRTAARQAGATGWIMKPFRPERLLSTVADVLARHLPKGISGAAAGNP